MFFELEKGTITRGHSLKIKCQSQQQQQQETAVCSWANWNSLTDNILLSDNINHLKTRLERFWSEKVSKFDPTGYHGFIIWRILGWKQFSYLHYASYFKIRNKL